MTKADELLQPGVIIYKNAAWDNGISGKTLGRRLCRLTTS